MGRKKTEIKIKEKPHLRPEQIVKELHRNNRLPLDFCPYEGDAEYLIENMKMYFLGDKPPSDRDDYFLINDLDLDRKQICISLPKPPRDLTKIDGYGLDRDSQIFRRTIVPDELFTLEEEALGELLEIQKRNRKKPSPDTNYSVIFGINLTQRWKRCPI